MVRGTPRLLLRALMILLITVTLAVAYGAWRISQGPWRVRALSPVISRALSDADAKRKVTVGETVITWRPEERSLVVEVHDVRAIDSDDHVTATVATAMVRLSTRALLRGELAISQIALVQPTLHLVREESGDISFGIGEGEATANGTTELVDQPVLKMIAAPTVAAGHGRYLRSMRVIDGHLIVDDRHAQIQWDVPRITVDLNREAQGIGGEASMEIALDGQIVQAAAQVHYVRGATGPQDAHIKGNVILNNLHLPPLAGRVPGLTAGAAVDLPLDIDADFTLAGDFSLSTLAVALHGGAGRLVDARLPAHEVAVAGLSAGLTYDGATKHATLDRAELALADGTAITVAGSATDPLDKTAIEGTVQITGLPMDNLQNLWPQAVAAHPRHWILGNLSKGVVREVTAKLALSRSGPGQPFAINALDGAMSLEKMRVTYFGQLPAVEDASASATFNLARFDIAVKSGNTLGLSVDGGQVAISGLDGSDHRIAIGLDIHGPLSDALTILDANPLNYMKKFAVKPKSVGGDASVRLDIKFPLVHDLLTEQLDISAAATLRQASVPKALRDYSLTEGNFALALDGKHMEVKGNARLNDLPVAARWVENFPDVASFRRRFEVDAEVDEKSLGRFGFDLTKYLTGPLEGTLNYTEYDGGKADLTAFFDGRDAAAQIPDLGWQKKPGDPITAQFDLTMIDGELKTLSDSVIAGSGLEARVNGSFRPGGELERVVIQRLHSGATDVIGQVGWRQGGGYDIALHGPSLDVSVPFNRPSTGGDDSEPTVPLGINLSVDRLILGPDRVLADVAIMASHDGTHWLSASIDAKTKRNKDPELPVTLRLKPDGDTRKLTVTAADAGALLKDVGITDFMLGGKLTVDGHLQNQQQRMEAKATIQNYRIVKAPILANILAVASVTGIPELLTGDGIAFESLTADIVRTKDWTELNDGRAAGLALGLTASGRISRPAGILDLKGTIVPIYALNQVIGAIPVIGNLLTGGEGGGLFAWTYTVKGPTGSPDVSVNPLSALAPSFLRHLFELLDTTPTKTQTSPAQEPPK